MKPKSLAALSSIMFVFLYNLPASADTCPTAETLKVSCDAAKTAPVEINKKMLSEIIEFYLNYPMSQIDDRYKSYVLKELNTRGYNDILQKINDQKIDSNSLAQAIEGYISPLGTSWHTAVAISNMIQLKRNNYGTEDGVCVYTASQLSSNFMAPSKDKLWMEERLKGAKYTGSTFKSNNAGDFTKAGELISCEYVLNNRKDIMLASKKQSETYSGVPIVAHSKLKTHDKHWEITQKDKFGNTVYTCKSNDVKHCQFNIVK